MVRAAVMFTHWSRAHDRMMQSMLKYLPEDVEITNIMDRETIISVLPDVVIGHVGLTTFQPYWAFISPKAVITEYVDESTISYFTERDVIFSYNDAAVAGLKNMGFNSCLWPRPVDSSIFYNENKSRDIDVLCVGIHGDFPNRAMTLTENLGKVYHEVTDLPVGGGDDALRDFYNRSKYVLSYQDLWEYSTGYFSCGYEVANVEAAFCGAIPIVPASPFCGYLKHWFGDFCNWARHQRFEQDLACILSRDYAPLDPNTIARTIARFSAPVVWSQFWDTIREVLGS